MPFRALLLFLVALVFLSPPAPAEQAQQHHSEEQQEDEACDSTHPVPPWTQGWADLGIGIQLSIKRAAVGGGRGWARESPLALQITSPWSLDSSHLRRPGFWSWPCSSIPSTSPVCLDIIILNESRSETERQIPYDIASMWNVKYDTNEPIYKTEEDSQT